MDLRRIMITAFCWIDGMSDSRYRWRLKLWVRGWELFKHLCRRSANAMSGPGLNLSYGMSWRSWEGGKIGLTNTAVFEFLTDSLFEAPTGSATRSLTCLILLC